MIVFIAIAVVAFLLARYSAASKEDASSEAHDELDGVSSGKRADKAASLAQPLAIELRAAPSNALDLATIRAAVAESVATVSTELGIRIPDASIVLVNQTTAPAWRIMIFDAPVANAKATASSDSDSLRDELTDVLRRHAERFLGVQEAADLLEAAAEQYPALVKEVARQMPPQKVAEVLRHLLREGVPVRNFRDVLEALAEWTGRERDAGALAECVRMQLKSYMTARFADADRRIKALLLDNAAEGLIRRSLKEGPSGVIVLLPPDMVASLRENVRDALARLQKSAPAPVAPVLIASVDIRRHVRTIVEAALPGLPVISYQELLPDVELQPLGAVGFGAEAS
jgi:type III secretion protein V